MKKSILIGIIIVSILLVGCAAPKAAEQAPQQTIKIGFMGPLSGEAASYGESIKRGVELAKADLKADNIEIVYEDSKCDGKEAVNAINKLISVDKVVAIIGEVCSGATLALAPVAEQNHIVIISPSSTSPKITQAGDYIFRVIPSDALQGDFGARLIYDKGSRKLAILYGNEEYGVGFKNVLEDIFPKQGGEIVASETFERGSVDLRTQLTKIKNAQPDAIYLITNSPDAAVAALKQIKELGIEAAVFGSEGLKSPDVINDAGDAAVGLTVTSVSIGTPEFLAKHKEVYGTEPGPFAAQGYDAFAALYEPLRFTVLSSSIAPVDAQSQEDLLNDVRSRLPFLLKNINMIGVSGNIAFDENGDVAGNYDVYEVKDGEFVKVVS